MDYQTSRRLKSVKVVDIVVSNPLDFNLFYCVDFHISSVIPLLMQRTDEEVLF